MAALGAAGQGETAEAVAALGADGAPAGQALPQARVRFAVGEPDWHGQQVKCEGRRSDHVSEVAVPTGECDDADRHEGCSAQACAPPGAGDEGERLRVLAVAKPDEEIDEGAFEGDRENGGEENEKRNHYRF